MNPEDLSLYLVTDPDLVGERRLEDVCQQALANGVRVLQLRDKRASTRELIQQARRLRDLARTHKAIFVVNDRVDVALAAGADGVHLGQDDLPLDAARQILGPNKLIGISIQTPEQASAAQAGGADYLAANLVFETPTKTDLERAIGLDGLRALRNAAGLPLVAIGGIRADNAASVVSAGANGVAVVSAIMAAPDIPAACQDLLQAVDEGRRRRRG